MRFLRRHLDDESSATSEGSEDPELWRAWQSLAGNTAEVEPEPESPPPAPTDSPPSVDPSDPMSVLNGSLVRRERRHVPRSARHKAP